MRLFQANMPFSSGYFFFLKKVLLNTRVGEEDKVVDEVGLARG